MRHPCSLALAASLLAASSAWSQPSGGDSTTAAWVAEADRLQHSDPAAGYRLAGQALARLHGPADGRLRLRARVLLCWTAASEEPDSLLAHAAAGLADAERQGDAAALGRLRVCRGNGRLEAGELAGAMEDYHFGVAQGERLALRDLRADALVYRGELRYYLGEFTGAVADLSAAHALFTELGNEARQSYALTAMANLYADSRVGQYHRALEYYRQVLAGHQATGNRYEIAVAYFNIASTYERQGRLEEALAQYRRGLAMDLARGDADEVAVDRRAIAIVLYKLGRPAEALSVVDRALAHFDAAGDPEGTANARLTRGIALRMLGRTGEAIAELEGASARYQATGNRRFLEKAHEERAVALAAAGRWAEAYRARSDQLVLQRALSDEAREEQSSRLRVQFDADKKERENRALVRENALRAQALAAATRIRRLQVAVLALSAVVIAALALLVARQVRNAGRLRVSAHTDELTGLPNRRHLLLRADEQAKAARAGGPGFGVLALDVDHFKRINDSCGHGVGDAVLRRVAQALRAALRDADHVGRTGGEEFVAVLPGASAPGAAEVAERVRRSVERTDFSDLHPGLAVTVSVGAVVWHAGDASFASTLERADAGLYQAKAAGRNRVEMPAGA